MYCVSAEWKEMEWNRTCIDFDVTRSLSLTRTLAHSLSLCRALHTYKPFNGKWFTYCHLLNGTNEAKIANEVHANEKRNQMKQKENRTNKVETNKRFVRSYGCIINETKWNSWISKKCASSDLLRCEWKWQANKSMKLIWNMYQI